MTFEQMKELMGENATDAQINAALKAVNDAAKTLVTTETQGLLTNKEKLLEQMNKLKKNQMPEGFDADAYSTYNSEKEKFAEEQKKLADDKLAGEGQWEALKLQLNETHSTILSKLKEESGTEISSLRRALDRELIENNLIKAIEAEKGNSLFLLPHMKDQIKTVQGEDGGYSTQVIDKAGNQRFQDDATTPFEAKDLVAEFKANDVYSLAFPNLNGGSGNDANAGGKGGTGVNPWKTDTKNVTEQARLIKENPTLAAQMKKSAGL